MKNIKFNIIMYIIAAIVFAINAVLWFSFKKNKIAGIAFIVGSILFIISAIILASLYKKSNK